MFADTDVSGPLAPGSFFSCGFTILRVSGPSASYVDGGREKAICETFLFLSLTVKYTQYQIYYCNHFTFTTIHLQNSSHIIKVKLCTH